MPIFSTQDSKKAFHLDAEGHAPVDIIPSALILTHSTVAGRVDGDEPVVRVPALDLTDAPDFVPEGEAIDESNPDDTETLIGTSKVALLVPVSREQYAQGTAASLLSNAVRRAMVRKANFAFLAQPAPVGPSTQPRGGLIHQGLTDGGILGESLDELISAIAAIEIAGGVATNILAHPNAWAALSKMKAEDNSNVSLIGAGTEVAQRRLLGLPVAVDRDVPESSIIVLDVDAVLSVYGLLQIAVSEDYMFNRDAVAVRATWRLGARVNDPARVVVLGVGGS
jgi:HK97 family phage major capsid protein